MRQRESEYWDAVAAAKSDTGEIRDNIHKRCAIVSRILAHIPIRAKILEIGVGQGMAAACLNLVSLGHIDYHATDVSPLFCEFVRKRWRLKNIHNTDILDLPEGPFDMIWAFDSLEHVHPEERAAGFEQISKALVRKGGIILINAPLANWSEERMKDLSGHEREFDHPFNEDDIFLLNKICGTRIYKWDEYHIPQVDCAYVWVELVR